MSRPPAAAIPESADAEILRRSDYRWRFYDPTEPREILETRREGERWLCRHDFFHWLSHWAWIENPKDSSPIRRRIPFTLWPKQRELADFLLEGHALGRDRTVNKSREIGATWLAMAIVYWLFWNEPGYSALLLAAKEDGVDNGTPKSMFGKLRWLHAHMPDWLRPKIRDSNLQLVNEANAGNVIDGASTSGKSARSTRYTTVVSDEWAFVERRRQIEVKLGLESVARSWWKISTPNGKGDDFHLSFVAAPDADKISLPWQTNPERTQEWFTALLRENGGRLSWDEREQEYNASFAGVSGQRVWQADRDRITYTDTDLTDLNRKLWPFVVSMDFGSGPSWSVALWIVYSWDLGKGGMPRMWVDREGVWQRRHVQDIGAEITGASDRYSQVAWYCGDPAGRAKDSTQESWESNLNAVGVPMICLPADFNTPNVIDQTLREVQQLLDDGMLKIHAERCPLLLESVESWEWDLPAGVPPELVPRDLMKPKKDGWSHPGDALRYGVGALLRSPAPEPAESKTDTKRLAASRLPMSEAGTISALFDRMLRDEQEGAG